MATQSTYNPVTGKTDVTTVPDAAYTPPAAQITTFPAVYDTNYFQAQLDSIKAQADKIAFAGSALNTKQSTDVTNTSDEYIKDPNVPGGLMGNPNYRAPTVVSSSDNQVQKENDITSAAAALKDKTKDADGNPVDYSGLDFLKDYQKTLEQRKKDEEARITADYEAAKIKTEKAQYAEQNTTNAALQRIGGYNSPSLDTTGKLISLAETHRQELVSLMGKRDAAINEVDNAINDKQFALATQMYEGIKAIDKEVNQRKQDFFDNALKLQKAQQEADKIAQDKKDKISAIKKDAYQGGIGNDKNALAALDAAQTVDEAMAAAGLYLQSSSNPDISKYLEYSKQSKAAGLTPQLYDAWQAKQDAKASALKASEAYSNAYASAKGKAKAEAEADAAANAALNTTQNPELAGAVKTILASGKFTAEQAKALRQGILNGDDPFTVVKNQAKNTMTGATATKLESYENSNSAMQSLQSALADYYKQGGDSGIFKGNFESAINKLGEVNDAKLVGVATKVAVALQAYRNAISGTAYSDQEGKDIAKIFPSITNGKILNDTITKARIEFANQQVDGIYRNTLGNAYDTLKANRNPTDSEVDDYVALVGKTNPAAIQDAHNAYATPGLTNRDVVDALAEKYGVPFK